MMRDRDPQVQEDGFHWLRPQASKHVLELIAEFERESDSGLRCWLLELIGEACDPRAMGVLTQQLHSRDESMRTWAMIGLKKMSTKEARKALYDAGQRE
ncbi:MAG TPA: HEAT repeat domain-containing protein [Pirellulaceae bacterium]|nr:HEAT repeat domain-containing protein [Pirellulaceae bacterium]